MPRTKFGGAVKLDTLLRRPDHTGVNSQSELVSFYVWEYTYKVAIFSFC